MKHLLLYIVYMTIIRNQSTRLAEALRLFLGAKVSFVTRKYTICYIKIPGEREYFVDFLQKFGKVVKQWISNALYHELGQWSWTSKFEVSEISYSFRISIYLFIQQCMFVHVLHIGKKVTAIPNRDSLYAWNIETLKKKITYH